MQCSGLLLEDCIFGPTLPPWGVDAVMLRFLEAAFFMKPLGESQQRSSGDQSTLCPSLTVFYTNSTALFFLLREIYAKMAGYVHFYIPRVEYHQMNIIKWIPMRFTHRTDFLKISPFHHSPQPHNLDLDLVSPPPHDLCPIKCPVSPPSV